MSNIRLSGLVSGLDTESIIKELMDAERQKNKKIEDKITTTEWTQEKWKGLNSKIYSFYTNQLFNMRFQSSFLTKKAVSSNENKAEATATINAPEGTHIVKVKQLASSQFITGAAFDKDKNGNSVTTGTKLVDLGFKASEKIYIETGSGESNTLEITEDTTLSDFISALKKVGLNASYDTTHKRLFISSKSTGSGNAFYITTSSFSSSAFETNENSIREFLNYDYLDNDEKNKVDEYLKDYLYAGNDNSKKESISEKLLELKNISAEDENYETEKLNLESLLESYADSVSSLFKLGLGEITKNEDGETEILNNSGATLIKARDAVIEYNDVELTGSSNSFTVNGLTLSLKSVTSDNEEISITVSNDTDAVYNMIKDFVKSYNELLSAMNEAYYAESARGYEPLTDEQKEKMTDDEIAKWNDKIKGALLRRDSILGEIINVFRDNLSKNVSLDSENNKTYSLSSLGIVTRNYSERGILYISGDKDFSALANSENKLKEALASDPEAVMKVFNKVANDLYDSLTEKMKSTTLSSSMTVYNDKELEKNLSEYKKKLSEMEDRLDDLENKYYKQFSAMEAALEKLNAQSSYISSLFGTNK